MPTLYGVSPSPFVRKVRVAAVEKGIRYDQEPVMPMATPEGYEKISPLKKIPAWKDGDFFVSDSSVILAYFERTQPEPSLYPSDAAAFARALWFEEFADSKLAESVGAVFFNRVVQKKIFKEEGDEAAVQAALDGSIPQCCDYLEGQLDGGDAIVGGRFSVADIAIGSMFVNLSHGGETVDAARWPKLAAYVEAVHGRPSFKGIIEEETAQFAAM